MVFNIVLPFDVCLRELPFSCNLHILSVDYMKPFFFLFFFFFLVRTEVFNNIRYAKRVAGDVIHCDRLCKG